MKTRHIIAAIFFALALSLRAEPVTFDELSFLIRMRESDSTITLQLARRRLVRALVPQQEATLRAQGASDALLLKLRDPKLLLSAAEAAAFDARREQQKKTPQQAAVTPSPPAAPTTTTPPPKPTTNDNDARLASGVDLIIDKLVIEHPAPIPGPYYVWFQAKASRAEATFNVPNKTYGGGVSNSAIEIPLNLTLKNVQLYSWATVTLQLDTQEQSVSTYKALKKHTGRIEIQTDPANNTFIPYVDSNEHFIYRVFWHTK